MTQLTDKQKIRINGCIKAGLTRKQISKRLGIPEGTISHYQNPKKRIYNPTTKKSYPVKSAKRNDIPLNSLWRKKKHVRNIRHNIIACTRKAQDITFTFTTAELIVRNIEIGEKAYRKAAVCTVNKLMCLSEMPIHKAIKQICDYQIYLINQYDLKNTGGRRVK